MDTELTEQHRRFIAEYLIDLNATQAYRRAYPECNSYAAAKAAASRLLKDVNVRAEIRAAQSGYLNRRKVSADKVLQKLGTIAFAEIVDIEGKTKLRDIPVVSRGAIKSIKYKDGDLVECKLHDSLRALELLFSHLGCTRDLPPLERVLALLPQSLADKIRAGIHESTLREKAKKLRERSAIETAGNVDKVNNAAASGQTTSDANG